jgi:hypothetical protein
MPIQIDEDNRHCASTPTYKNGEQKKESTSKGTFATVPTYQNDE